MGILDSIVEWVATQIMNLLDMITGSVLGALGCDMSTFLRYFPAAETLYEVFVAISEPSFAKILLKLTPMDTVRPTSAFTVLRISFAISTGVRFFRSGEPVREIQLSSIPKDSTSGEYRRYMLRTSLENFKY